MRQTQSILSVNAINSFGESQMKLEHHHMKYQELDGIDEVIITTRSNHPRGTWLLKGLSQAIPRNILSNAHNRLVARLDFTQEVGWAVQLHEMIRIEPLSGKVFYNSRFRLNKGRCNVDRLPVVDI